MANVVNIELIADGFRYKVQVCQSGVSTFFLVMNDSYQEVEVHRLSDGGMLLSLSGASYTTYMKEEIDRYRIIIGNQTCVFEKESDPSVLRSLSAGKLINLLVENQAHVKKGQVYAEIEVMKMVMSLSSQEAGIVTFSRRPGSVLQAGSVIGHIELDDPTLITSAKRYAQPFPKAETYEQKEMLHRKHNR